MRIWNKIFEISTNIFDNSITIFDISTNIWSCFQRLMHCILHKLTAMYFFSQSLPPFFSAFDGNYYTYWPNCLRLRPICMRLPKYLGFLPLCDVDQNFQKGNNYGKIIKKKTSKNRLNLPILIQIFVRNTKTFENLTSCILIKPFSSQ